MPPKSIFRQPGAKHFQLVHRSQRDPLIHDPDASQHVLKPFELQNKKGKSRADLEEILPESELDTNIGEASLYGVYYDDSEYNYMQHLRTVGVQEDGVESVLIEAPSVSKKGKGKGFALPDGVLASTSELPRTYESQQAVPASIAGFQPDMDPHLRQVLEALEDDAFVEDNLEDDFFGELVGDGERGDHEEVDFEFFEDGADEEGQEVEEGDGWEAKFSQFKKTQARSGAEGKSDDGYEDSEGGDTVGTLPAMSVIGGKGKKRRKGTSDASGYSMSSSSMYRNEALQTLDERFDQMILKQYNSDDEDEPSEEEDDDAAPELITSREDFESMMDEFLNDYEILGRKMKPKLAGDSGAEKLDTLRRAMGMDERVRVARDGEDDEEEDMLMPLDIDDRKDRWDCETILTTYSNLENHPRLIRARDADRKSKKAPVPVPKILLDPRTGLPSVVVADDAKTKLAKSKPKGFASDSDSDLSSDDEGRPRVETIKRDRNESKEAKKARKAAVKEERQARRADKKATKEQFEAELKTQKRALGNKERRLKSL
ncbi:Low temperature viability protein-domain-containing protein [Mycena albidolilacea]|uniref:Low temperature viability protein-domain-containing protein n=1 Tax=Mycena albidolilacea TaxID=1033008 RepID=A0AAD7AKF1_9AGAR|nr:Low temperature viability protein-domain-containing protein [Mycena albidolilacea]